jgi:hypothetical protein
MESSQLGEVVFFPRPSLSPSTHAQTMGGGRPAR